MTTKHPSKSTRDYGALLGEQYTIPIQFNDELTSSTSCSSSTFASAESDALLLEHKRASETSAADLLFRLLGFETNPMRDDDAFESNGSSRNSSASDLRLSMLSNVSTAYNVVNVSLSLQIMKHVYTFATPSDSSICSSALIAGMIVGQLTLGALGDVLGRHRAMAFVMLLQVVSAFGSAFSADMYGFSVFQVLASWRFLLGLGCGGVYPLSATLTTESSQCGKDRAKLVALTFSSQGVGYLAVPLIALLIVSILGESSDVAWRLLLGLGSVPGALLTIGRCKNTNKSNARSSKHQRNDFSSDENTPLKIDEAARPSKARAVPVSIMDAISLEHDLARKLLGTAGSWLLFDILFYGNTLFQPVVLAAAFGSAETVATASRDTLIIALMALPGYYATVFAVGRQSPRFIQVQGFFAMGILYLCIGVLFKLLAQHWMALLAVYGSTFFFSNYGPNATTFMLPSMTFSRPCRSTLNGVSAACGKAGALIGATVFVSASRALGQPTVFFFCSFLSFIGCFLTLFCVTEKVGQRDEGDEKLELNDASESGRQPVMKLVYSHPSIFDMHNDP
jgi:MFS transporter, PHS family, inorganic phosphate transporter